MTHRFLTGVFSLLLLLGWIAGLIKPVSVEAGTLFHKEQSNNSTFQPMVVTSNKNDISSALISIAPEIATLSEKVEIPNYTNPKANATTGGTTDQTIVQSSSSGSVAMPAPVMNFEGVSNVNSVYPPDTQGDIGPNHYIQWVNLSFEIWSIDKVNRTATSVYGPAAGKTLWSGFGGPCETSNSGDPITFPLPIVGS
jgi:hypothetical protein